MLMRLVSSIGVRTRFCVFYFFLSTFFAFLPDVGFIITNAASVDLFNFSVQLSQHLLLIIRPELPVREHPAKPETSYNINANIHLYSASTQENNQFIQKISIYLGNLCSASSR